jgi:hypothetical protein
LPILTATHSDFRSAIQKQTEYEPLLGRLTAIRWLTD